MKVEFSVDETSKLVEKFQEFFVAKILNPVSRFLELWSLSVYFKGCRKQTKVVSGLCL